MKRILFVTILLALVPLVSADPWSFSLTTWGSDANPFGAGYYTSSFYNGADSVRVTRDFSQFRGVVQTPGYSTGVTLNNPPTRSYAPSANRFGQTNGGYDVTVNRGTNWQLESGYIATRNSGFSIAQTPTGSYGGTGYVNGYARPRTYRYAPYYGYPGYQFTSSPGWAGYGSAAYRPYGSTRTVVY